MVSSLALYGAGVSALWGFLEAWTYFRTDALRQFLGPYWVLFYALPAGPVFFLAWSRTHTRANPQLSTQSGTVDLASRTEPLVTIFYPTPFSAPPHLTLEFEAGGNNGRCQEQRADGFSYMRGGSSFNVNSNGIRLRWTATGTLAPKHASEESDA